MITMLQRERKRGSGGAKLTFAFRPCASAFTLADCIPPRRRDRSRSASASEQPRGVCGYSSGVDTRRQVCASRMGPRTEMGGIATMAQAGCSRFVGFEIRRARDSSRSNASWCFVLFGLTWECRQGSGAPGPAV